MLSLLLLSLGLLFGSVYIHAWDSAVDPTTSVGHRSSEMQDATDNQPPDGGSVEDPAATASPTADVAGQTQPNTPGPGDIDPLSGGPGAATDLRAAPRCEETGSRGAVADLSWTIASTPGDEQRVAVTKFREGFDNGSFDVSATLPPDAASFTWRPVNPGGVQYWRVLTRHGSSWAPSDTAMFTGPTCVADYVGPAPHP